MRLINKKNSIIPQILFVKYLYFVPVTLIIISNNVINPINTSNVSINLFFMLFNLLVNV